MEIPRAKASRLKTVRLHAREEAIIDRACGALGIDRTSLMTEAAIHEAVRLGVRYSLEPLEPLKKSWPYLPERGDEPTAERVTLSMTILALELVKKAAEHVHASEPQFLVGATLAFIGRLRKCYQGSALDTPEEAAEIRKKLEAIKLPAQYEYRRGQRR